MAQNLIENLMVAGNHLASQLLGTRDPAHYRDKDYTHVLNIEGQPYADIFIAWKAIMEIRDKGGFSKYDYIVENFINDELCVHEGGIVGSVSFCYDDATFNHIVTVGSTPNKKASAGRGLRSAVIEFKKEHRNENAPTI